LEVVVIITNVAYKTSLRRESDFVHPEQLLREADKRAEQEQRCVQEAYERAEQEQKRADKEQRNR
jgi:hypothetical protein